MSARPGRDRRAVLLPAAPGRPRPAGSAPHVAVAGGGIAGLAAATALAERGVRVTLFERHDRLGGRLSGTPVRLSDGRTATVTRGFHAFFRQYYNLRALLRRCDPELARLTPLPDYPLWHRDGHRDSFKGIPRTPPWNALTLALTSPSFPLRDLARVRMRAVLPLLDVRAPGVYDRLDGFSAGDLLRRVRFPPAAHHLAFEVFSRSFFAPPAQLSAAEMALMFHIYFLGSAEGLLFDVPDEPSPQALWDPLAGHLAGLGAELRLGTPVDRAGPEGRRGITITAAGREHTADALVLALDTEGLRRLVAASPALGSPAWRDGVARLRTAPPFLVTRVWLDRPVREDRPAFLGTAGYGPLDNVSVLERYEGEARRHRAATGGSVVELHSYAVPPGTDRPAHQDRLLSALREVYPETRAARVRDVNHQWHEDCPLFAPGTHSDRPTVTTHDPRLVVAGDLVRTGLPVALMERAATSGFLAANALLRGWGLSGHPLWTVPDTGRLRALRHADRRWGTPRAPAAVR